jgi:hypothetical protein
MGREVVGTNETTDLARIELESRRRRTGLL